MPCTIERVWPHKTIFFVHSYCKQIMNIVPIYKQASHLLPVSKRSCTHVKFMWNVTHVSFWLFGSWISKLGNFLLKLRADHLGKFVPREINLLHTVVAALNLASLLIHDINYSHENIFVLISSGQFLLWCYRTVMELIIVCCIAIHDYHVCSYNIALHNQPPFPVDRMPKHISCRKRSYVH